MFIIPKVRNGVKPVRARAPKSSRVTKPRISTLSPSPNLRRAPADIRKLLGRRAQHLPLYHVFASSVSSWVHTHPGCTIVVGLSAFSLTFSCFSILARRSVTLARLHPRIRTEDQLSAHGSMLPPFLQPTLPSNTLQMCSSLCVISSLLIGHSLIVVCSEESVSHKISGSRASLQPQRPSDAIPTEGTRHHLAKT